MDKTETLELMISSELKDNFNLDKWVSQWKTPKQKEYLDRNRLDPNGSKLFHPEEQTSEKVFFLSPVTEEEYLKSDSLLWLLDTSTHVFGQ